MTMSEFAPGFAGRIQAAAHVLHRAFGEDHAFAAADVGSIGRRGFADPAPAAPRHFSPADPGVNPTEGWDPFATEVPAATHDFIDPVAAAREAGYAEGHAAALAEIHEAKAREAALLDQVSTALATGAHFDRERMAGHLRQTVLHLVQRMIGEAGVAPDVLAGRVHAAVELLSDHAESALLRLHPDDVPLVQGRLPTTVFPVGDPHVARGSFVIESASTIVEDGPDIWLEQLAQAIDRVPIPPLC
ncbi:FliH/SctL family protein [Sphingomonas sp. HF-S4]|uniref:Flagellar assembly protein FliH n=1 Tax=Sphingomonas agrestis TaxID=3080540 RepID=A0ABU3YAP9_9SPHN|nr:FliH/SctL family protein [Sphingomonas sp. HF-S4]MDV3458481.1 FliH/SctL family protein [Sphingomonas sp. HF-S4]